MKALVTANLSEEGLDTLKNQMGIDVDYRPIQERDGRLPPEKLETLLQGVDIFVVGYEGVSADLMDSTDLEIIACPRGGPDANINIEAATERNIPVLYTPGRNAESVADFTLGLLLGAVRHIAHSHHLLHEGVYTGDPVEDTSTGGEREDVVWGVAKGSPYAELKGVELNGRTLGIIGFGAIGQKVAQRAQGFGMDVIAYDPYVDDDTLYDRDVERVNVDTLCRRSDVITVHAVVTEETRGLLGEEEFSLMKDSAYFVNTARASIADQDALIQALENDNLGGAALDVYDMEPIPEDHALFQLDSVVTTPHIAAATTDVINRHSQMIVSDLEILLNGDHPNHIANEQVLEQSLES
ncbi:2-hydroxyacid dehydrogenase [Halobellus rarus]|uniref:2-hydroxyacid dehydrogenase n=1 Tax=Halobellus rarus TaxID=1126237 RepID=A0ABD6CRJ5_9EURY|nr:2-hydroxyacid dehydrogenase [Halobellus rarus]